MRRVQIFTYLIFMLHWDERGIEYGINLFVEVQHGMTQLAQDRSPVDVVQYVIVFVRLVWESAVIKKDVICMLLAFWLGCYPNRCRINGCKCPASALSRDSSARQSAMTEQ